MSFVEGFAKSLGSYFTNKAVESERAEREKMDYEWKLKKAQEYESQAAKTKVVGVEYFEQNGRLVAQPVNAAGEPVGSPRPANPAEVERRAQTQEERKRKIEKEEQELEAGRFDAANRERVLEADLASKAAQAETSKAYGESARAQAASVRAELERQRELQSLINKLPEDQRLAALTGGKGRGREGAEPRLSDTGVNSAFKTAESLGLSEDPIALEIIETGTDLRKVLTDLQRLALERQMQNNPKTGGVRGSLSSDVAAAASRFNYGE